MEEAYIVLEETSARRLAGLVNHYMSQGYALVGGVSVAAHAGGWLTFAQAMVKEAK